MELNLLNDAETELLRSMIAEATNIVICGHRSPDGDAIGSSLAWMHYLHHIGKSNVKVCMPDAAPDFLHWLPGQNSILRYDRKSKKPTLCVVWTSIRAHVLTLCRMFWRHRRVPDSSLTIIWNLKVVVR